MATEAEGDEDIIPPKPPQLMASLLWELPSNETQNSVGDATQPSITGRNAPWIAVHEAKSAVIVGNRTRVGVVTVSDAEEARNVHQKTFETSEEVLAMAFSACGGFLAVADAAGTLSLYKSNGALLFGHRVVSAGDSDGIVSIKFATSEGATSASDSQDLVAVTTLGTLLRLGDLRLAEFEQVLREKPKEALGVILRNIRFERTKVGRLREKAQSCLLVHRFESEEFLILGNHGAFGSVWKTALRSQKERTGIEKVSACDSRSAPVDAMGFDANYSSLVILSEGKLSWWNWRDMTEMFEADVSEIMSFAVIRACAREEHKPEYPSASLLAIARSTEDGSPKLLFELVRIEHLESDDAGTAHVVSRMEPTEYLEAHAKCTNVALFASPRDTDHCQALAAYRTRCGVSMLLLTGDGDSLTSEVDGSFVSGDGEVSFTENAVTIAESLVDIPIASLMQKRAMKKYQGKLDACTSSIGESDDESRAIFKQLLQVAVGIREYTSSSPRPSPLLESLLRWCDEISDLSYKWTTFQLLRSSATVEAEAEASGNALREKWNLFRTTPMVEMLGKYIKLGSMRAVRILWGRHLAAAAVRNIGKLLQYLPAPLPVSAYADWIQSEVLPTLIRHVEQTQASESDAATEAENRSMLTEVTLWLLERSEAAAATGDLDTAIRICNLLKAEDGVDSMGAAGLSFYKFKLQASSSCSKSLQSGMRDGEAQHELGAFERINGLGEKLRHVQRLAVEHHFVISLSVFEDETPATIAMSMLDRVFDPESLKQEIEKHVRKYLQFCGVDVDPVLHDYVTELAESIQSPQSAEETRALVLLDEISDANVRADATLALLRSVLPPYSQALTSYAKNCTLWKTQRLEEIEEHVRLMKIQDMLMSYGIKQFDIADAKSSSRLVSHILNQVTRPTAWTDALLLVDAYSDMHCDRAVVRYTENLLSDSDAPTDEVSVRVAKAMGALAEVKQRKDPKAHIMLYVSLMEEIIEFGVTLLEMEAEEMDDAHGEGAERQNELKPQSFTLCMLKSLVAAYLSELKAMLGLAGTTPDDSVSAYIESADYLLTDALMTDLRRIGQVEADYEILLSVSVLRDPQKCEAKLKQLMKPEILFAEDDDDPRSAGELTASLVAYVGKGKGKKRAVASNDSSGVAKKQRTSQNVALQSLSGEGHGLQQDDERTRLVFDLNRFSSAVGIDSKACQALIAQRAAKNGSILQAVRFSRDLFSRRANTGTKNSSSPSSIPEQYDLSSKFHPAEALKKIAISLSLYTSSHVKEIYDVPLTRNQQLMLAQLARVQAPMYTLELLRYALCMCDKESFDETLILLKTTMLVNEILQFTQHSILTAKTRAAAQWTLYPRWYRGDACALASFEAMKLVTRFAIAEHKNLHREVEVGDTIASKRYVSFLVDQRADLLSLQALMSMHELPEDAASVANTQMGKLLSTVFQSQEIDNYLALGLMLSMKQEDAFHAFRRQISRENVAKDFNRFQQLAFIGADAARAWQQIAFLHQCVELEGNARWWHYLNLLEIECDHKAFQSERRDLQYIRRLVPTLITRSNYDFYTVLEFTRHYQIEDSFPSLVYAESLLLEEAATTNLEYQDKIAGVIEEIHDQHLMKLLLKSIPKIRGQDYDRLLFIFRLLLDNTSYRGREEVERRVEVLSNLKAFAAFQAKSDSKTSEKFEIPIGNGVNTESNSANRADKPDSKKVSFHELIAEPRDVLARLVTKENFNVLIGLAEPLRLEPDELQMLLLKNMITTNLKQKVPADGDSNTSLAQFSAFEGILDCLSDTESRVTAAEWLAENFPLGDEKLKALEFALNAAVSGHNGSKDPSNTSFTGHEALTRLETKIMRVKVEVLLRNATFQTSSLAEVINDKEQTNQLLALVSEPKKLFLELYRRYALWFYKHSNDMLHAVASSIGDLLQLPQAKLRLDLVREWLVKDAVHVGKSNSSEEAQEDPFELLGSEKLHQADEDFGKRILYLATASVKSGDVFGEQVLSYFVEFAKDSRPRAGVTYRARLRALRVILRLGKLYHAAVERFVTTKYGIENSDSFFKELLKYTKHCTHMITFEEHRVPYDMAFVLKSDKEVLTRSFLRRFPLNQPWVLRCASQLMLDFGVEALDLWEDVLTNMLRLRMVRSLATIMGPLSRKSFVRSLECGRQVWDDVLTLPMTQLKHNHSNNHSMNTATVQGHADDTDPSVRVPKDDTGTLYFAGIPISNVRSVMGRMVALLQKCPFLDQIDVPVFVIHLRDLAAMAEETPNGSEIVRHLDLYGFAVKCAMVIPKPVARFEALVRIIQAGAYSSVLHELLDTSCFLDGEKSENAIDDENGEFADNCRLIHESFSEAAKRGDYSAILDTPFEPGFVEYLAATADIDYLLSLLLEDKRMEAALNAVELYYEYHPTKAPPVEEATKPNDDDTSSNKRWELIDAYLVSSRSAHLERFRAS
ncbi:hypothetical protein PHYPSEUDO_012025 [Phytophthora pseudosyringae]|uniref:RZZ complex subunit KNTC1/ROD C-terminal domain-containing protein n=1 Tax=Phytophthora pseudosyringae TaxID=221518 RepID=A0A8T1VAT2_9STRA|nr:hypothetical protein PHYPSEUDO_012025 [Phytophthora pseudosyringae]